MGLNGFTYTFYTNGTRDERTDDGNTRLWDGKVNYFLSS